MSGCKRQRKSKKMRKTAALTSPVWTHESRARTLLKVLQFREDSPACGRAT